MLVYVSCWLKCHYPDVFCAAIINSQPMGFYAPAQLIRDAREHGVDVREVDINLSDWDCLLEPDAVPGAVKPQHVEMKNIMKHTHAVRLGLRLVKGVGREHARQLIENRANGYDSVRDLWMRSGLPRAVIEKLADADCFRSLGLDRREALWAVKALDPLSSSEPLPLFACADSADLQIEPDVSLPSMPLGEHVMIDYQSLTFSLKAHPISFLRNDLKRRHFVRNVELQNLRNGARVSVAGLVLVRQRPGSAKGVIFETIEDETGVANVIIWPKTFEKYRTLILGSRCVGITGKLQHADNVIHVVAHHVEDLTHALAGLQQNDLIIESLANADEVRRPVEDIRQKIKPRSRLQRLLKDAPELKQDYAEIAAKRHLRASLPKGRNFH